MKPEATDGGAVGEAVSRVEMSSSLSSAVTKVRAWKPTRREGGPSGVWSSDTEPVILSSQAERPEGSCPRRADPPRTGVDGFTGVSGDAAGVQVSGVCVSSLEPRPAGRHPPHLLPTGVRGAGPHVPEERMVRLAEGMGL